MLSAAWVLPIARPPIREGAVVVGGDGGATVVACGARADLRRSFPGVPERRAGGALLPGLVNAHTHLELAAVAGEQKGPVPGGRGLVDWTRDLMALRHRRLETSPPDPATGAAAASEAATAAAVSARALGTAAIGDVGNGIAGWLALRALGFRGLFFHELVGTRERTTGDALADAERERERAEALSAGNPGWQTSPIPMSAVPSPAVQGPAVQGPAVQISAVPAPHAPYSVGPELMRRIFAAAARAGHPTSIHLAEDPAELELLEHGTGPWVPILQALGVPAGERTPHLGATAYLERLGAFASGGPPPLLVHMVHASPADLARTRTASATVVLCPRSNLHIGSRLPPVPAMHAAAVRLALGTDSLASTPDLSLWRELAVLSTRFPDLPPAIWLRAATLGGAEALCLGPGQQHPTGEVRAPKVDAGADPGARVQVGALGALVPDARPGLLDVELDPVLLSGAATTAAEVERALVSNPTPHITWMVSP
jgi:cytosine/adenosine deaminase-related metal-dependent hydrolase